MAFSWFLHPEYHAQLNEHECKAVLPKMFLMGKDEIEIFNDI